MSARRCPDAGGDAPPPYKAGCWLFDFNGPAKEGDIRVLTACKADDPPGRVGVRNRCRLRSERRDRHRQAPQAPAAGLLGVRPDRRHLEIVGYRSKTWRHLDLGRQPLPFGVHAQAAALPGLRGALRGAPWGRPGSPYTRDFEDVIAFLAQAGRLHMQRAGVSTPTARV